LKFITGTATLHQDQAQAKDKKRFMSSNRAPATSLFRVTGRLFCATFSYAAKTGKEE